MFPTGMAGRTISVTYTMVTIALMSMLTAVVTANFFNQQALSLSIRAAPACAACACDASASASAPWRGLEATAQPRSLPVAPHHTPPVDFSFRHLGL